MKAISSCGLRSLKTASQTHFNVKGQRPLSFPLLGHHHGLNPPNQLSIRFQTISATRINRNPQINPPSSTLPSPLVLPVREPDQSTPSFWFKTGKAYLSFYKTGAKAVYANWKIAQEVRARIPQGVSPNDAVASKLLSRAEWQLLHRSRQDVMRVPLFALVFLVCGEFTPLVVVFMSGAVPRTCQVPKQVSSDREKAEIRRGRSFREGTLTSADEVTRTGQSAQALSTEQILHIGRSLGLFSSFWDRVGFVPVGMVQNRMRKRIVYLEIDDKAIENCGGVGQMELEEVRIALEERGMDVLGKNDTQLRGALTDWLRARKSQPTTRLLLTRPSVWTTRQ